MSEAEQNIPVVRVKRDKQIKADNEQLRDPVENRIGQVLQSAKKKDSFRAKFKNHIKSAYDNSSWLKTQTVPEQKTISSHIEDATRLFRLQSLSDSQKAKRGEKFRKKAVQQANMINMIQDSRWKRSDALKNLLDRGKTEKKETYLENAVKDIDEVSEMIKDLSFYYELQQKEDDVVELIADKDTRNGGYMRIIEEFDALDLAKFEYNNNNEFMEDTGENSFVKRLAELRAFSHVRKMLDSMENAKEELGEEEYLILYTKAALVSDILEDYEHRAMLIQSPYHVLLAGKDFDSFSLADIDERILHTNDELAKEYLRSVRHQKEKNVFRKGSKVSELYLQKEADIDELLTYRATEKENLWDDLEIINREDIESIKKEKYESDKKAKKENENPETMTEDVLKDRRMAYMKYKEDKGKKVSTYIFPKQDEKEVKKAESIGESQENHIKSIEKALRRNKETAYEKIDKKRTNDDAEQRTSKLFHSEGTWLLENEGHDVLEFDVAGSGYAQFVRAQNGFNGIAADSENIDEYELSTQYGERFYSEKSKETLKHVRKKTEEGVSLKAKGKYKTRYTIAGPTPEGIIAPGAANVGEYKIENTINRILEISQLHLEKKFKEWEEEDKKAEKNENNKPERKVDLFFRGHSRGGIGASLGAMKVNYWLHKMYPQYAENMVFHLTQLDPVAGFGSNYGGYDEIDHNGVSHTVHNMTSSDDPEFRPLGENAQTTVVYSINTQYSKLFTPQVVKNAKRIIITPFNHSVGQTVEESDMSQLGQEDEKLHAMAFYDAATGNVYRQSGLDLLADGVYIMDEKHVLIKINYLQEYIDIMQAVVPKSELESQKDRQISIAKAIGSKLNVNPDDAEGRIRAAINNMIETDEDEEHHGQE